MYPCPANSGRLEWHSTTMVRERTVGFVVPVNEADVSGVRHLHLLNRFHLRARGCRASVTSVGTTMQLDRRRTYNFVALGNHAVSGIQRPILGNVGLIPVHSFLENECNGQFFPRAPAGVAPSCSMARNMAMFQERECCDSPSRLRCSSESATAEPKRVRRRLAVTGTVTVTGGGQLSEWPLRPV